MIYFNGFSLKGEENLFSEYLLQSDLCVAGFSHGAQQAFEYVYNSQQRVDRLILLSPAFFQTQNTSFVRTQMRYFQNGQERYVAQFLQNVAYPSTFDLKDYLKTGTAEELEDLLIYKWDAAKIEEILDRGTVIEVFLGAEDKIIDVDAAFSVFSELATTYFVKGVGHLLK